MTLPALPDAELAVMELLWNENRLTARDVRERLYPDRSGAHGTVQKLLQRLEDKGFVGRDRSQAVHVFTAAVGRDEYAGSQLVSLADRLTDGSLAPFITQLVESEKLSREEIRRLRKILEDA